MLFKYDQLLRINGALPSITGALREVDGEDIAFVVQNTALDTDGTTTVNTFDAWCRIPNTTGLTIYTYKRNSLTMAQFKTTILDIQLPSNPLKLYTSATYIFKALQTTDPNYNSSILINDNFMVSGVYNGTSSVLVTSVINPVQGTFKVTGNQLGGVGVGVGAPIINRTSTVAANATATLTTAQVLTGVITSTSAAATSLTFPTATALATAANAAQGTWFPIEIDNSAGANAVTLLAGAGITIDADVTTAAGAVGQYILYFTSTTTARLMGNSVSYADQTFTGTTTVAALNYSGIVRSTGTPQTLTGAGAVNITTDITLLVTTAANALTLADGAAGQHKYITMITDGGDGTLTPTNLNGGTTITFDAVGDSVHLLFANSKWNVVGLFGAVVA